MPHRILKHPLRVFRESQEPPLSQAAAAALVGITQGQWSQLEAGKAFCRPSVAKRISELTGVAIDRLLNFRDPYQGEAV